MYKQLEIFDFIEKTQDINRKSTTTLLERVFGKIENPVMQCNNCLCERCVNNVEDLWSRIHPEEQRKPCFNCDECRYYTGDQKHKTRRIVDCEEFVISDYAAANRRKKLKIKL